MLVIISDLHLADGTTGETIRSGAFNVLTTRLREMAESASWRRDGTYQPIERIDLVLLGDIVDQIRSTEWTKGGALVRPWHDPQGKDFVDMVVRITEKILNDEHNAKSFALLKKLNDGKTITIPPATKKGQAAHVSADPESSQRVPVEVRIHYMVGNHDWFLHLPGERYNELRARVNEAAGLYNSADPYPHSCDESDFLADLFQEHNVFARHGDVFDTFNYVPSDPRKAERGEYIREDRDKASLGDALVVELFNRFPDEVDAALGADIPPELSKALRELGNIRPALVAPAWIDGLIHKYDLGADREAQIKQIWDKMTDDLLEVDFVKSFDKPFKFDVVDGMRGVLKIQQGFSFDRLSELVTKVQQKFWKGDVSFVSHAVREKAFQSGTAEFIVYGHTHEYEVKALDAKIRGGRPINQLYINSGTWRPLHELGKYKPERQRFVTYKVITMLGFYRVSGSSSDERGGRAFEAWTGVLS